MAFLWIPGILGQAYGKGRDAIASQKPGGLCLYFVFSILGLGKHGGFQGLCCLQASREREGTIAQVSGTQRQVWAGPGLKWSDSAGSANSPAVCRLAPVIIPSEACSTLLDKWILEQSTLLGGFQLSSNRGQYPIRCSSEDQQSGHDKMIKCQSLDQKPAHEVLDYWQIATAVLMLSPLVHWWAEKLSQAPKKWPRNIQVVGKGNEVL